MQSIQTYVKKDLNVYIFVDQCIVNVMQTNVYITLRTTAPGLVQTNILVRNVKQSPSQALQPNGRR